MKAISIIGANWGDESKGKMVDYFSDNNTIVIKSNGGSNSGHTVIRDGIRHVFHHFGSGTLAGASTYLSKYFINNPILFLQEWEALKSLGFYPKVYADEYSMITTPWDMMINTILEESRGHERHGSCGVGINETVKRHEIFAYQLVAYDLKNLDRLAERLKIIQKYWIPDRLKQLDLNPSEEWMDNLNSEEILNTYVNQCEEFLSHVILEQIWHRDVFENKNIVFEGAQGLLLDEDHYFFPHVTHSHTGLKNVLRLCEVMEVEELDVVYVTRAYATRHGAGPFPREVEELSYKDYTNIHNMFQGTLRFGHLDIDLLKKSIENDLGQIGLHTYTYYNPKVRYGLAMTCMDQMVDKIDYWYNGVQHTTSDPDIMMKHALQAIEANKEISFVSYGPTADDVSRLHKE
jgi:adenylosuccinate synthase